MIITEDCINCTACAIECPVDAILEPKKRCEYKGIISTPLSMDYFFIVPDFCDECSGLKITKCKAVCPMNAIKKVY